MAIGVYPRTERHRKISRENGAKSALITGSRRRAISRKISKSMIGHSVSKETRSKIGSANSIPLKTKLQNQNRSVGYLHKLLTLRYGKPKRCEGRYHTIHSKRLNWALKKGRRHSANRKDYIILCQKCHYQYDLAEVWENYRRSKLQNA